MKSKITYFLLATLLITNCTMLFMLVKKPHERHGEKRGSFLIKNLGFNEKQKEKFLVLEKNHLSKRIAFDDEVFIKKRELFDSFSNSGVINETVIKRIGELEGAKEKEIFSFFNSIKTICNEEQKIKLDKIIREALIQGKGDKGTGRTRENMPRPPHGEGPPHGDMPPPRRN